MFGKICLRLWFHYLLYLENDYCVVQYSAFIFVQERKNNSDTNSYQQMGLLSLSS